MSLSRAFTSRRAAKQHDETSSAFPLRSASHRYMTPKSSLRSNISGPVHLISTTNMMSYTAPEYHSAQSLSPSSDEDSETYSQVFSNRVSHTSSTDSIPPSPAPNHLTAFFHPSKSPEPMSRTIASPPAIPQRANSHTTATHKALARKRSLSRTREIAPPTSMPSSIASSRPSGNAFSPAADHQNHPFSRELQQVNELAEEMGLDGGVVDEEERLLFSKGLQKFSADDYLLEILGLYDHIYEEPCQNPEWI